MGGRPGYTFLTEHQVRALFDDLETIRFHGEDEDGEAFGGPEHWHVYDVIARRPSAGAAFGT